MDNTEYTNDHSNGRTSADFRAMRERIGWSQNEVGRSMGIDPELVKKWENPNCWYEVLPKGWDWIDRKYAEFWNEVDELIDKALEEIEERGIEEGADVSLSYYRNGAPRYGGARTRHHEPAGAANAVSRAVGDYLGDEGYKVHYVWAEDGGWLI